MCFRAGFPGHAGKMEPETKTLGGNEQNEKVHSNSSGSYKKRGRGVSRATHPAHMVAGIAVLRQQYVLAEAIQAWVSSLNIV